jgi:hypothetical protein
MAVSGFCAFDKKGKDVFFEGQPEEYDLFEGLARKAVNPADTIRTENWGYFQAAFERVMKDSNSPWKDYDCYLAILCTAGVSGVMWIVMAIIEIHKFRKGIFRWGCKVALAERILHSHCL